MLFWSVAFCTIPVVFMADDFRAGIADRIGRVIPQVYPQVVYVHLIMGGIHGVLPANPGYLGRLLALQSALTLVRFLNLACFSGLWLESFCAGAVHILPTALGCYASRSLIASGDSGPHTAQIQGVDQ